VTFGSRGGGDDLGVLLINSPAANTTSVASIINPIPGPQLVITSAVFSRFNISITRFMVETVTPKAIKDKRAMITVFHILVRVNNKPRQITSKRNEITPSVVKP